MSGEEKTEINGREEEKGTVTGSAVVDGTGRHANRWIVRLIMFPMGLVLILLMLGYFLQPIWTAWNNFSTFRGIYKDPKDTIETVFLGSSYTISGFSPMEIYEDYGICAYNLSSEQQPILVSYYWLREAYRLNPNSLKSVILNCSNITANVDIALYRKAIDAMHFSEVKYQAVKDYAKYKNSGRDVLCFCLPFLGYHDRWASLGKDDFLKRKYPVEKYTRGYMYSYGRYLDSQNYDSMSVPSYILDSNVAPAVLSEENTEYFNRIIAFCTEKNLKLILITSPGTGFPAQHNLLSSVAEENHFVYLDFNYAPLFNEIGINRAVDTMDGVHLNYYGAVKLTKWLGTYLYENCDATDVRKNPRYAFLEEELDQYHKNVTDVVALEEERELCSYMDLAMKNKEWAVFLIAKDDASSALDESTRTALKNRGLEKLSKLGFHESYLALFEQGHVVFEETNGKIDIRKEGVLRNGHSYSVYSGGYEIGNRASCIIDGVEYAWNSRGINFVIYNERTKAIVDTAAFDTFATTRREVGYLLTLLDEELKDKSFPELSGVLQKLYLYNYRCAQSEKVTKVVRSNTGDPQIDLLSCLDTFRDDPNVYVYLTVQNDASALVTDSNRESLAEMGLKKLSDIKQGESYVAVFHDGEVCLEKKGSGDLETEYLNAKLLSSREGSDRQSYIMTNNSRKDMGQPGINVVIYDSELRMVLHVANFAMPVE